MITAVDTPEPNDLVTGLPVEHPGDFMIALDQSVSPSA